MALDSRSKRLSMINFISGRLLPDPSGTVDQAARQTFFDKYSGILFGPPAVVGDDFGFGLFSSIDVSGDGVLSAINDTENGAISPIDVEENGFFSLIVVESGSNSRIDDSETGLTSQINDDPSGVRGTVS